VIGLCVLLTLVLLYRWPGRIPPETARHESGNDGAAPFAVSHDGHLHDFVSVARLTLRPGYAHRRVSPDRVLAEAWTEGRPPIQRLRNGLINNNNNHNHNNNNNNNNHNHYNNNNHNHNQYNNNNNNNNHNHYNNNNNHNHNHNNLSFFLVTGERPSPCQSGPGAHALLRSYKNKVDYCTLHGCKVWYMLETWEPGFGGVWARYPALLRLMQALPDVEWFMWMDADAIFTDFAFEIPFRQYDEWGKNFVAHGFHHLVS
jgi:hypothetical protein